MSASQPIEWTVAQLAQAVERGQLELHYQPIVDLRSEQIVGAEALLRWRHPTLGLLPPGQFLPVIESSGLMPEIGAWVLGAACRQMRDWRVLAWQPFRLAVNVSASQVGPDFDKWVKGVLADAGLPAAYLEIELTESVAFGDPAIFPALEALRQIGVRFAADDFGTGYSCLQHLKCCPISTLKIDQSFVAGLANDHRDQTIVRTVIQLAHGLGMEVVAEGVETSASLDLLRQADCDTGQGLRQGHPAPATGGYARIRPRRRYRGGAQHGSPGAQPRRSAPSGAKADQARCTHRVLEGGVGVHRRGLSHGQPHVVGHGCLCRVRARPDPRAAARGHRPGQAARCLPGPQESPLRRASHHVAAAGRCGRAEGSARPRVRHQP